MNKIREWLFNKLLILTSRVGNRDLAFFAPGTAQKFVEYLQYQDVPQEYIDGTALIGHDVNSPGYTIPACHECGVSEIDEFLLAACDTYSEAFSHLEDVKGIEPMQTPGGEWGLKVFILNGMLLSYLPRQFMTFPVQYVINGVPE